MTEKRFYIQCDECNAWSVWEKDKDVVVFDLLKCDAEVVCKALNELSDENKQLKSTIAQLIEQNRKNNDLLLSDIRILEKALWCSGCENDYGRLKELRKEFIR